MLLLVTILLVLVAAVTLLIGIFSDELTLIFVSIGASALAAIVLAVLSQMSRKKGRAAASDAKASEPLPGRQAATPSTPASDAMAEEAAASIETIGEPVTVPAGADTTAEQPTTVVPAVSELAIANYDSLRVNEILPKLEGLDLDELEDIAQHEESRKNRTTVLNRIDALMDQLEAAASTAAPAAEVTDELAAEAVASIEEIGEPVVAIADDTPDAASSADDGFPIPNYDSLSESELIPLLADLDADQLEAVADREEAGPNRDAVLDAIDDRLDILEGIVPAPAAAPVSAAADEAAIEEEEAADELPVEVAVPAATRAPAKKASAKKAAAVKKAPAARKVAATPAKKAASTATATASKAAATKATAKKAPAKAARKTVEPAKKAAPTRAVKAAPAVKKAATATTKAAAKKAPAKKATAAKKAAKR